MADFPLVPSTTCLKMTSPALLQYLDFTGLLDHSFKATVRYRFHESPTGELYFKISFYAHDVLYQSNVQVLVNATEMNISMFNANGDIIFSNVVANPNPEIDTWHKLALFSNGRTVWLESETDSLASAYDETTDHPLMNIDSFEVENNTGFDFWIDEVYFENVDSWLS